LQTEYVPDLLSGDAREIRQRNFSRHELRTAVIIEEGKLMRVRKRCFGRAI
jgi:hypothetical protein